MKVVFRRATDHYSADDLATIEEENVFIPGVGDLITLQALPGDLMAWEVQGRSVHYDLEQVTIWIRES